MDSRRQSIARLALSLLYIMQERPSPFRLFAHIVRREISRDRAIAGVSIAMSTVIMLMTVWTHEAKRNS